jgi:hypothetical protein
MNGLGSWWRVPDALALDSASFGWDNNSRRGATFACATSEAHRVIDDSNFVQVSARADKDAAIIDVSKALRALVAESKRRPDSQWKSDLRVASIENEFL